MIRIWFFALILIFETGAAASETSKTSATPSSRTSFGSCRRGGPRHSAKLQKAQQLRGRIVANPAAPDTESDIMYLEYMMESCELEPNLVGATPQTIKQWRRQATLAARERLIPDLQTQARRGTASALIQKYEKLSRELGGDLDPVFFREQQQANNRGIAQQRARCATTVDISSRFGPTRNQGAAGWCYGFVAADLVSFKTGQRISAADISMQAEMGRYNSNRTNRRTTPNGGESVSVAVNKAAARGFCLEAKFRSDDDGVRGVQTNLNALFSQKSAGAEPVRACPGFVDIANRVFPQLTERAISDAIRASSRTTFLDTMRDRACQPRIAARALRSEEHVGEQAFAKIDEQIASGQPVGLNIAPDIIRYGENFGQSRGGHAVTVVGRRFNEASKQCEYLLRNSWGPSCRSVDKNWSCDRQTGNTWIPRTALEEGLESVYTIK